MIDFRPAKSSEAAAIGQLVCAAYARWVPVIGREPMPMRVDYEKALAKHQFDLATDHDTILGVIETMPRDDHLWIENVAVLPAAQGRGIGRRLLAHAEQKALTAGQLEIRLLTNKAFENGVTVYMSKNLAPGS